LLTNEDSINENSSSTKIQKPPQMFVHGVINYEGVIKQIIDIAEDKQYWTKSPTNNVIKINCVTPETYRKLVTYFKDNNIFYHTYQLREKQTTKLPLNIYSTQQILKI
jgi:hypothetical protein